jgi:hypothetical protein
MMRDASLSVKGSAQVWFTLTLLYSSCGRWSASAKSAKSPQSELGLGYLVVACVRKTGACARRRRSLAMAEPLRYYTRADVSTHTSRTVRQAQRARTRQLQMDCSYTHVGFLT